MLPATPLIERSGPTDDRHHLVRVAGLALPAAVWVLGIVSPPRTGLTPTYLAAFSALLAALIVVDQTAPRGEASLWRRLVWLSGEVALCFFVVQVHGSLIRPALIYLLPTSRALLMFGERWGLGASLSTWLAYIVNVGLLYAWPDRLREYPNYLSFFLVPYLVGVMLTLAALRQAADRRRVQKLYDELRVAHEQLQAMHQQTRELAVTQERNRLAREIHDTLAHYLTVINVQLEAAEKLGPDHKERALEAVHHARRLAVRCLQEVRHSVASLRAPGLEQISLPKALRELVEGFTESTRMPVRLELEVRDDLRLPPETALALYRAAQEGLTNVHRHAQARSVNLSLALHNGHVQLVVQDDGRGPSLNGRDDSGGFGLLGLKERVELLGGQMAFGPGPSGGSRLAITLPVQEAP